MRFLKEKKVIIILILGVILASCITVYAYSYYARDIGYTKPGTETSISVEQALNDLYKNRKENIMEIDEFKYYGNADNNYTTLSIKVKNFKKITIDNVDLGTSGYTRFYVLGYSTETESTETRTKLLSYLRERDGGTFTNLEADIDGYDHILLWIENNGGATNGIPVVKGIKFF